MTQTTTKILVPALAALFLVGCKPKGSQISPCTENGGDSFCQDLGFSYCSLCREGNGGCVIEEPADDCKAGGGSTGPMSTDDGVTMTTMSMESGDVDAGTTTTDTTSTTGPMPDLGPPGPCDATPKGMVCILGGKLTHVGMGGQTEMVDIPTFAMDRTEVSVGSYRACVTAGACTAAGNLADCTGSFDNDALPINCVRYQDGEDYCAWADKRLPGEDEWEWAARGRELAQTYPWGSDAPSCTYAVMDDPLFSSTPGCGLGRPHDVGMMAAGDTPDGVANLGGNVREWTEVPGVTGTKRYTRGGAYNQAVSQFYDPFQVAARLPVEGGVQAPENGFRCVLDL